MQSKVSFLTRKSRGGVTRKEQLVSGESIRLGRSTDNEVHLSDFRVSLSHAAIHDRNGRYYVEAESGSDIRINTKIAQSGRLATGDRIGVGPYDVEIICAEEGQQLEFTIELVRELGDDLAKLQSRSNTSLTTTGLSKRRWSWLLFIVVTGLFLALPISAFYNKEVRDLFIDAPVTADIAWKSGEFAAAHRFFADDCQACHQKAFETVRDKACVTCHTNTHPHADPKFFELAKLNETRCATCHKEHNGRNALIRRDEALCGDCHTNLTDTVPTELENARDFGNKHANFNATIYQFDKNTKAFVTKRVALTDNPEEISGLTFPHDKHMNPDGLKAPDLPWDKKQMRCNDCHTPEPSGVGMQPINMERDCIACHSLAFEEGRTVPHGKLELVLSSLTDYYGNKALAGGVPDPNAPRIVRNRRRPGQKMTKQERKAAYQWAQEQALTIAEDLFEGRVCSQCHTVTQLRTDYPPKWEIAPVNIIDSWLPKASFTHKKHETMVCTDCHDAKKSEDSTDVLIPDIDNCRQCHGGTEKIANKLESTCVDCHGFHIAEDFLLGDRKGMDIDMDISGTAARMEK